MYKTLADSTLQRTKKKEIIELLRIAEHNAKVSQEYVDQQAQNFKDWAPVVHGRWYDITTYNCGERAVATCSNCKDRGELRTERTEFGVWRIDSLYCPNCGAKMDGGDNRE